MISLFEKKHTFTLSRLISPIIVIFILVAIYFIVATSFSSRYLADDFCAAVVQKRYGFWGAQKFWWKTWSGRFSYNFFLHIATSLGAWAVKILPVLIYLGLTLSLLPVLLLIFKPNKYAIFKSVLLSSFLIIVILINAPNIVQTLYWQTGVLTYTVPFIFFNLFISTLFIAGKKIHEDKSDWILILLGFSLTAIGGGFNETFALAQITFIFLLLTGSYLVKLKGSNLIRKLLFWGLVGSISSILIMLLSPGLHGRESTVTQAGSLVFLIKSTLLGTKWYLQRIFTIKTSIYSFAVLLSLIFHLVGEYIKRSNKKVRISRKELIITSGLSLITGILVTSSVFGVSYYATSYLPRERVLFTVIYFIFLSFVVFSISISALINTLLSKKILDYIYKFNLFVFFIFIILLFRSFYFHWGVIKYRMEDYARAWDFQEELIYKQKENGKDVVIKYLKPVGDIDGFVENEGWVSSCAASYYGVDKINITN